MLSPKSYLNYGKDKIKSQGTQSIDDLAKSPFVALRKQNDLMSKTSYADDAKS